MFTSMRNVMKKKPIDSKITSKNTGNQQEKQKNIKNQANNVK